MPVLREVGIQITAYLRGNVKKEAGHFIGDIGLSARFGSIVLDESNGSSRAESLVLEQIVMNTPHIHTELDGVITNDLSPVVYAIDVSLRADPGKRRRVSDHRIGGAVGKVLHKYADLAAGKLTDINSGNAGLSGIVGAVPGGNRAVAVMCHAQARLV